VRDLRQETDRHRPHSVEDVGNEQKVADGYAGRNAERQETCFSHGDSPSSDALYERRRG